jgi:6-pyruvoyltetrahydropterin/6-carboxytetrahydropterin synthase
MFRNVVFVIASIAFCCVAKAGAHSASGYSLGVRDSIMIAHSFTGEEFGPAQSLHGATYTVDVELSSPELVEKVNWVIDIGEFSSLISEVISAYNFKNLNDIFPDENTTTEFMCRKIHDDIASKLKRRSPKAALSVKLHESHKAWASFSNTLE